MVSDFRKIGGLLCLLFFSQQVYSQKLDKEFRAFYKGFQRNVAADSINALKNTMYFPFQTIYWIDGMNALTDEEKADGMIDEEDIDVLSKRIFNEEVRRVVPAMEVERVQQIDVEGSGDYYKRLAKVVDKGSTLLELYCQVVAADTLGDEYFAFIFGKVNNEYRILSYYTTGRIKN